MLFRFFVLSFFIVNCSLLERSLNSALLEFKGEQVLSSKISKNDLPVGGLSALFYDSKTGWFYALSDDKKNHRIYKLSLKKTPKYEFEIVNVLFLKSPGEDSLKRNMDPEAMARYGDTLLVASEGQQIYKEHEPTQILSFNWSDFTFKSEWPVSEIFWPPGAKKQAGKLGQRENKGFESLSLDLSAKTVWTAVEMPLYQDLKHKAVRLTEFDLNSQEILSQYLYPLANKTGLTALHFLRDKNFLALERSFSNSVYSIELYLANCSKAVDVKSEVVLTKSDPCSKKRLWSSKELGFPVDNLEGMALIPIKNSRKKLLTLISDNNFKNFQKNQVLFFEVSGL